MLPLALLATMFSCNVQHRETACDRADPRSGFFDFWSPEEKLFENGLSDVFDVRR